MWQQYADRINRLVIVALIALIVFMAGSTARTGKASAEAAAAASPMVVSQVFDVNCISVPAINATYIKLTNLATFDVHAPDSEVELTFNGRIFVGSFSSGTGAVFELRVDDLPSNVGRARANLRTTEAAGGGRQTSITGIFTGLSAGSHTASMWVRTSTGGAGTQAMVDPGCWSTDVLIEREFTPFGAVFLPSIIR